LTVAFLQLPLPLFFASAFALLVSLPAVPEQHKRLYDFGYKLAVKPADILQLFYNFVTAYIVSYATFIVA
jgi:hypothetical protein